MACSHANWRFCWWEAKCSEFAFFKPLFLRLQHLIRSKVARPLSWISFLRRFARGIGSAPSYLTVGSVNMISGHSWKHRSCNYVCICVGHPEWYFFCFFLHTALEYHHSATNGYSSSCLFLWPSNSPKQMKCLMLLKLIAALYSFVKLARSDISFYE